MSSTMNAPVVRLLTPEDPQRSKWNAFVESVEAADIAHCFGWAKVLSGALGTKPVYITAENKEGVCGVVPVHIIRTITGKKAAISVPFLNGGGILAQDEATIRYLVNEVYRTAKEHGCAYVELRHLLPVAHESLVTSTHKVSTWLPLQGDEDIQWKGLHTNVRNKIRKAEKSGVVVKVGKEHLGGFYGAYARNMRDLGTPVLPKTFFETVASVFAEQCEVFVAYVNGVPIGGKFVMWDKRTMYFIWASSMRPYLKYAPNDALNWEAIRFAIQKGLQKVDFGRSSPDSTHLEYKKHWGVQVAPYHWQYLLIDCMEPPILQQRQSAQIAARIWRRLPLWAANWLGPKLAKHLP